MLADIDTLLSFDDKEWLKQECQTAKIPCPDLVLDIFALLRSQQPATDAANLAVSGQLDYWAAKLSVAQRREFLSGLVKSQYFLSLHAQGDPRKAVLTLLQHMQACAAAKRKCRSREYEHVVELTEELSEEALEWLSNNPESLGDDWFYEHFVLPGMEEEELFVSYSFGLRSQHYLTESVDAAKKRFAELLAKADRVGEAYLRLYELFTMCRDALGIGKETEQDADDAAKRRPEAMAEYEQVTKVDPTELAGDDFDVRFASKKLTVSQPRAPQAGAAHLYVLLDVTGSMDGTPATIAVTMTLALLEMLRKPNWIVHLFPFDTQVLTAHAMEARTYEEGKKIAFRLSGLEFDGGGTNIEAALLHAYKDVKKAEFRKCDIVLITDGQSPLSKKIESEKPHDTKIVTFLLASRYDDKFASRALAAASDRFSRVHVDNNGDVQLDASILKEIGKDA